MVKSLPAVKETQVRSLVWEDPLPGKVEPGGSTKVLSSVVKSRAGGSVVKSLPAVKETQVRSLVWEDPLKEGTAAHSSTLAWRTPGTEEPGGLQSIGSHRVRHD